MSQPEPPPPPDPQTDSDFDDVERMTRAFVRWGKAGLIFGLPVWIVLLIVMPATGLGALGAMSVSTLAAVLFAVVVRTMLDRRAPASSVDTASDTGRAPRPRAPMSAPKAVLLTMAGVLLVVYIIFIAITMARGG